MSRHPRLLGFIGRLFPTIAITLPLLAIGLPAAWAADDAAAGGPTTQPLAAAKPQFLRFVDQGSAGGRLETAVAHYRNKAGVSVDLVAAVHIGEASYFQGLNKSFEKYDAVLYELVKPRDVAPPTPGQTSDNPISQFQHFLKNTLNLEFQLDVIDYTKPNFVHADLDKETFERLQAERGETFEAMLLHQLVTAMTRPQPEAGEKGADAGPTADDLIKTFTRPDMERQVKLLIARQFGDIENTAGNFGMGGTVILGERNKQALKVLSQTLAGGKKKIAIFYGAAHMPELSQKLVEMGFTPVSTDWNMAWDLTIRPDAPSGVEQFLNQAMKALDDN